MIYKGRIIDIGTNCAVVMTDQADFYKVIKKDGLSIGKQIIFLDEDIYIEKSFKGFKFLKYAAVLIFLLTSTLLISQYLESNKISYTPMAIVSLDINPSIEFEIDQEYRLLSISSKNNEGDFIISDSMIGKNIEEVIYISINNAKLKNYITEEKNSVLIGISALDENFSADFKNFGMNINNRIKSNEELKNINIIFLQGDKRDLEASRQNNITIGKYKLYLNLLSEDSDLKLEDVKSMNIQDLLTYTNQKRNNYQWNNQVKPSLDEEIDIELENKIINQNKKQQMKPNDSTDNQNNNADENQNSQSDITKKQEGENEPEEPKHENALDKNINTNPIYIEPETKKDIENQNNIKEKDTENQNNTKEKDTELNSKKPKGKKGKNQNN